MKKIYSDVDRDKFWANYWREIQRDPDELKDSNAYPLFPASKYVSRKTRILEAGCGMGRVLKHFHYLGYDIVGIEYDRYCVDTLKKEDSDLSVYHASVTDLPFNDHEFDVVMAFGLIGHLEHDWDKALKEIGRVLRPGGVLAGSLCVDNIGRKIFAMTKQSSSFYTWLFDRHEIAAILDEHGYTLLEQHFVTTREHIYKIPLFRKSTKKMFTKRDARVSDKVYELNFLGRFVYAIMKNLFAKQFAFTSSFVARRRS